MLLGLVILLILLVCLLIGIIIMICYLLLKTDDSALEEQCFALIKRLEKANEEINLYLFENTKLYDTAQEKFWVNKYSDLLHDISNRKIIHYKNCINYNVLIAKKNELHKNIKFLKDNILCHNVCMLANCIGERVDSKEYLYDLNKQCALVIEIIKYAISEMEILFNNKEEYINELVIHQWKNKYSYFLNDLQKNNIVYLKKANNYVELFSVYERFHNQAKVIDARIKTHNESVLQFRITKAYEMLGQVEGTILDKQQMESIVIDAYNHLVIAGAGTGKTTTIVGKIKYLLMKEKYQPEEMLVLSFTNASATEMRERIKKETGYDIAAYTFHKLGLNIIAKVEGKVPKITQINLRKFIKEQLHTNIKKENYLRLLNSYLMYYRFADINEEGIDKNYEEYLRWNPPTTIFDETVKSYGEMDIANFLIQHGIEYRYEQAYEVDTRDEEYAQYYPDFYLPEYKIYIEYFGINRKGEVPDYFKSSHKETAKENYQKSMEWKRKIHKENNTVLIECFAFEKFEGDLIDNLKEKLICKGIQLQERDVEELWKSVVEKNNSLLDGIIELFETVINLMKSNNYSINKLKKVIEGQGSIKANKVIIELIEPIFESYILYLQDNKEIDFNDMVNKATQYVEKGLYVNPYKYVIIDEYQDISKARFNLMKSLRKSSNYGLFCVGDDWQSIYRFAGSDISYILDFDQYWGVTVNRKIETTYRFNQQLIDVSSLFVMQNPKQIRKHIVSEQNDAKFALGIIEGYTERYAIQFMVNKLDELPEESSVYFIGRYSFDVKMLDENADLNVRYDNTNGLYKVIYYKRLDLNMYFLTVHKAKGLQADYVFIINNKKTKMGFPSKIQDAPILNLLLNSCEQYPYAEERRLFYVALTRAKKKAYLVVVKGQESEFATELIDRYADKLKGERYECPVCGGKLIKRNGPYGAFWGCSNYKSEGCTYKKKFK